METSNELHAKLYPYAASKKEYILCAAMHYDDGRKHEHQPENIVTGFVVCARRHHNAIIIKQSLIDNVAKKSEEGFITSKDRFVNRFDAAEIAWDAGQTPFKSDCLVSEELY